MKHAAQITTLRLLRLIHGLTQADLGRIAGVTQAHISRIEHGRRKPSLPICEAITNAVGGSTGQLFPGSTARTSRERRRDGGK